jgi:hypothetical protein
MTTKHLKVYLNVYDFTTANKYLSCIGMGGYHTGVEIKYIYSYKVINNTAIASFLKIKTKVGS